MHTLGWATLATGLLLFASGDDAALKKEQKALQGTWKMISVDTPQGKKDDLEGATLEFASDGKNLTYTHNGKTQKATYKLNPAGNPKEIDLTIGKDKLLEGIYQIDKDMLKICLSAPDANDGRPNEFAVKDGKSYVVITLQRAK